MPSPRFNAPPDAVPATSAADARRDCLISFEPNWGHPVVELLPIRIVRLPRAARCHLCTGLLWVHATAAIRDGRYFHPACAGLSLAYLPIKCPRMRAHATA
jgi:hypothetical protein